MVEAGSSTSPSTGAPPYLDSVAEAPFEVFFAREYRKLVAFGRALTGDQGAAEDLAQDAMWAAQRRWARVATLDSPSAWVRRAVANRAASRLRRVAAEARAVARLPRQMPVDAVDGPEAFWVAVRSLPARQAQVVTLRFLEEYTTAEIASVLGCAEPTVRVHLARARATLARSLGVEEGDDL
jgi:RNA polymerase sigma-70 factor (ECF subfamily)